MDSGDKGIRTLDPLRARQVLSQLSYAPKETDLLSFWIVETKGFEPLTPCVQGRCSPN